MTPEQKEQFRHIIRRQITSEFRGRSMDSLYLSTWAWMEIAAGFSKAVDDVARYLCPEALVYSMGSGWLFGQLVDALAVSSPDVLRALCYSWPEPTENCSSFLWWSWFVAIPHVAHPASFSFSLPIFQRRQQIAFASVEGEPWWWEQLEELLEQADHSGDFSPLYPRTQAEYNRLIGLSLLSLRPLQNKEITLEQLQNIPQDALRVLRGHTHLLTHKARGFLSQRVKETLFQRQEVAREALILLRELESPSLVEIADLFLKHCEEHEVHEWYRVAYVLLSDTWKTFGGVD